MHRKSRSMWVRLAVALAAVLATVVGLVAFSGTSSAAAPTFPAQGKTAKISNAFVFAQCHVQVDNFNYQGGELAHLDAQSQSQLLGGLVKSTAIHCVALDADNVVMDTFNYVGTGAYLNNTRKTGVYPISFTYNVCATVTVFFYSGTQSTGPTKCTT